MVKPLRGRVNANSDFIKFFKHFGVNNVRVTVKQVIADCPFPDCQKEQHFFVGPATGQWDCKRCHRKGNPVGFLREFHAEWLSRTTDRQYSVLADARLGISPEVFKACRLAYNSIRSEWMIPSFTDNGLSNLYTWRELYDEVEKSLVKTMVAAPTFPSTLFGMQYLQKSGPLFILEGHWDWLAWFGMVWGMGILEDCSFVAVPGATNFPKSCLRYLHDRDVYVLLDNDEAGITGVERLIESLALEGSRPKSFFSASWPTSKPVGYDVRDFITDAPSSFDWPDIYEGLINLLRPIDLSERLQASYADRVADIHQELCRMQRKMEWLCKRLEMLKVP